MRLAILLVPVLLLFGCKKEHGVFVILKSVEFVFDNVDHYTGNPWDANSNPDLSYVIDFWEYPLGGSNDHYESGIQFEQSNSLKIDLTDKRLVRNLSEAYIDATQDYKISIYLKEADSAFEMGVFTGGYYFDQMGGAQIQLSEKMSTYPVLFETTSVQGVTTKVELGWAFNGYWSD